MTKIPKIALFGHIFKNSTSNFLCMANSIGPRSVYTQFDFKNAFKKKNRTIEVLHEVSQWEMALDMDHGRWPFPWSDLMVQHPWSNSFIKKTIKKHTRCKPNVDQEE